MNTFKSPKQTHLMNRAVKIKTISRILILHLKNDTDFNLSFKTLIPASFLLVEALMKLIFLYGVKLHPLISFNVLHVRNCFPRNELSVRYLARG